MYKFINLRDNGRSWILMNGDGAVLIIVNKTLNWIQKKKLWLKVKDCVVYFGVRFRCFINKHAHDFFLSPLKVIESL